MKKIDEVILDGVPLKEILEKHKKWLDNEPGGECANFKSHCLEDIDFSGIDLSGANFNYTTIYNSNFSSSKLHEVNFIRATIYASNFSNSRLHEADFYNSHIISCNFKNTDLSMARFYGSMVEKGTSFENADMLNSVFDYAIYDKIIFKNTKLKRCNCVSTMFKECNFENADLSYADLHRANFLDSNFKNINIEYANFTQTYFENIKNLKDINPDINIPMHCPSEGAFIAWKAIKHDTMGFDPSTVKSYLVKLQIPASAKRSSSTSNKCRASKAKVLGIYDINGNKLDLKHVVNTVQFGLIEQHIETDYIVGKMVYPDSFDENRFNECSNGIHFFLTQQEAIDYIST